MLICKAPFVISGRCESKHDIIYKHSILLLLKPALNPSYDKVAGLSFMSAPIFLNKQTLDDLLWFADQVKQLELC